MSMKLIVIAAAALATFSVGVYAAEVDGVLAEKIDRFTPTDVSITPPPVPMCPKAVRRSQANGVRASCLTSGRLSRWCSRASLPTVQQWCWLSRPRGNPMATILALGRSGIPFKSWATPSSSRT